MKEELMRLALLALLACGCAPPIRQANVEDIPKLTSLKDVMDVQSTYADPQWKKINLGAYSEADYAAFIDVSARIGATSDKIKAFSKGADFDALATRLKDKAAALGAAAQAKNGADASRALAEMKATCRECHSKFR
jgi:hypothetical protein